MNIAAAFYMACRAKGGNEVQTRCLYTKVKKEGKINK